MATESILIAAVAMEKENQQAIEYFINAFEQHIEQLKAFGYQYIDELSIVALLEDFNELQQQIPEHFAKTNLATFIAHQTDGEDYYQARGLTAKIATVLARLKTLQKKAQIRPTKIVVSEQDLGNIWTPNMLRIFISHRDSHKIAAQQLSDELKEIGMSGFVAHESIEPTKLWKDEIHKALETMDGLVAILSTDFHQSVWTNQEIGFALAKKVPIFLYSIDRTDPAGFLMDIQAIKSGVDELKQILSKKYADTPQIKRALIKSFCEAINGNFDNAKNKFVSLLGLAFTDNEIDEIVSAFKAKARYINQLDSVMSNKINERHSKIRQLKGFIYYREALQEKILKQHSTNRYRVADLKTIGPTIIDSESEKNTW